MRNALNYFVDYNRDAEELYIFLDEVTSLEDWNLELKYLADLGVTAKAPIVATGSSAFGLKTKAELLPGRGLEGNEYYFKPLCFRSFVIQSIDYIQRKVSPEFADSLQNLKKTLGSAVIESLELEEIKAKANLVAPFKKELEYLFRIYLITGGFPRAINYYLENKKLDPVLAEIFIRNVLGDMAKHRKQEILTRQILYSIIEKYGSRYSFSNLAREIESTHATVIDYLEFLEGAFILSVLYAYDFNKKDIKFKGSKKVYFTDPFIFHSIRSYLTGRELWREITETLEREDALGKLVEGVVCSHLARIQEKPYMKDSRTFLRYYYDASGKEIDFIIKDKDYLGVEVKYKIKLNLRELTMARGINNYLTLTKEEFYDGGEIFASPVEIFLALLETSEHNL